MENTNETLDSSNEDTLIDVEETDDVAALKDQNSRIAAQNRQLFARAKKAEGFSLKDGKWMKEEKQNAPNKPQTSDFGLVEKGFLRAAGITTQDEVDLVKDISKRTGMDLDELVDDDYFKTKLDALRTQKSNLDATSKVKGGRGTGSSQNSPEYWEAKGEMPQGAENKKLRLEIIKRREAQEGGSLKFYNS